MIVKLDHIHFYSGDIEKMAAYFRDVFEATETSRDERSIRLDMKGSPLIIMALDPKTEQFETLKPWLLGQFEALSQADAARRLSLTEGAVKVAIHRLRKRFRELVKAEIAHTVTEPVQVQGELRYLVEVLSS